MEIELREMTIGDYQDVYTLWKNCKELELSDSDSKEGIRRFLERNSGLSFIALDGDELVGAALCGHDGRRGYIHHLAVKESHRHRGIGKSLVNRCMFALMRIGISKCHLFVFEDNQGAIEFWKNLGWTKRVELDMMSQYVRE
jgi:putative acetyltransferase